MPEVSGPGPPPLSGGSLTDPNWLPLPLNPTQASDRVAARVSSQALLSSPRLINGVSAPSSSAVPTKSVVMDDGKSRIISYAAMVSPESNHSRINSNFKAVLQPISLPHRPVVLKNNEIACLFSPLEIDRASKQFENTLVMKFGAVRPPLQDIRNHISSHWNILGSFVVGLLDPRHVMVYLESKDDVVRALSRESHIIGSTLYRLFRWDKDYNFRRDNPRVAVWIRLHHLPLHYFNPAYLQRLGNSVGSFLRIDNRTLALAHPMYARICVEVDVSCDLPERVWVGTSIDDGFWQPIEYEGNISYCTGCGLIGHLVDSCRKRNRSKPPPKVNKDTTPSFDNKKDDPKDDPGNGGGKKVSKPLTRWTPVKSKRNQSSYGCGAATSECYDVVNGGYRCRCPSGFEGNPYLSDGCQDVNECISDPCSDKCNNLPGTFSCSCPPGYKGDGMKNGSRCQPEAKGAVLVHIFLGICIGLLVLVVASSWIYWIMRKRKIMRLREQFFQQNGGFMLKQQLSGNDSVAQRARIFTVEDLKKATNNYEASRIIGQGGFGTVYKGLIQPDNREVAIKKSKISDQSQIEQFINEVVVLSQINHRNVVKLLGCCLETEVPLLVYEFIPNGTLSEHLHERGKESKPLSWEMRLKIAAETAEAIAYLHSAISMPIIHRDIKSTNILLDETYTTKVSDFGASKLVPLDYTQLTTMVQGTFGYLDPEYFHSSQLTEKSDVYSFGVLLAELLTGEKALSFERAEKDRNLAMYFVNGIDEERLIEILDNDLVKEGDYEQMKEVALLAKGCLRVKGEKRPSMKEVARELERLRSMADKHPWVNIDLNTEETEHLLHQIVPSDSFIGDITGSGTSVEYDTMRNQVGLVLHDGR